MWDGLDRSTIPFQLEIDEEKKTKTNSRLAECRRINKLQTFVDFISLHTHTHFERRAVSHSQRAIAY